MKKKIEVTVLETHDPSEDISQQFNVGFYKEIGLYLWEVNGQLVYFDGTNVFPLWMETKFCDLIELPPAPEEVIEDDLDEEFPDVVEIKSDPGPAMVSEDLFLKTVAILQDADIVTDLVKGSD